MSKVSFINPGVPPAASAESETRDTPGVDTDQPPTPESEHATETGYEVGRPQGFIFNEDEVSFGDIKFPRLHLVQKVGQLSNIFAPGEIVFNLQLPIYTPPVLKDGIIVKPGTEPLFVVTIAFKRDRYAEQVPDGSEEQGLLLDSLAEVARAHGTLNYKEHRDKKAAGIPSREFKTLATALFLVRKPGDVSDPDHILFPLVHEDTQYVLASYDMKGGAFSNGAQVIRQAKKIGYLKEGGLSSFSYSLGTLAKTWQTGRTTYIPVFKPGTKTSEELRKFIRSITGN